MQFYNGKKEYSNIISLNVKDKVERPKLFPNPTTDVINMIYSVSGENSNAMLQIHNSIGQIILEDQLNNSLGSHSVQYNMKEFGSDIYFFKIIVDDKMFIEKVIIR